MKNLIAIVAICVLAGCSSLKVSYDYDNQVNFGTLKTYAFTEESLKLPIQDLDRSRIVKAVENEMTAEGFSKSDNPDVLIDLHVKAEQKTEATATTSGAGGMYGGPWRYGYGGGFSTTQVNYHNYVVGTLFVNMVSKTTDKIVWQGRASKTIDEDANPEKRETNINYAVKQIFTKYPPKK